MKSEKKKKKKKKKKKFKKKKKKKKKKKTFNINDIIVKLPRKEKIIIIK